MNAGLCATCRHVKTLRNDRGSVFYMCQRAEADPRYKRYPPLPVLQCPGHEPEDAKAPASNRKP